MDVEVCVASEFLFLQIPLRWARMGQEMLLGRDTWWTIPKMVKGERNCVKRELSKLCKMSWGKATREGHVVGH